MADDEPAVGETVIREPLSCSATGDSTPSVKISASPPDFFTFTAWWSGRHGIQGRAPVEVRGTIDGEPLTSSFMAPGDGMHRLPVKAGIRKAIGKGAGQSVTVRWTSGSRHRPYE
jgi:hypothetical protein